MKQVKQLAFAGLTLAVSLLVILGLIFRILLPYLFLIAAPIALVAVVVGINILIEHYSGDPPDKPEQRRRKQTRLKD